MKCTMSLYDCDSFKHHVCKIWLWYTFVWLDKNMKCTMSLVLSSITKSYKSPLVVQRARRCDSFKHHFCIWLWYTFLWLDKNMKCTMSLYDCDSFKHHVCKIWLWYTFVWLDKNMKCTMSLVLSSITKSYKSPLVVQRARRCVVAKIYNYFLLEMGYTLLREASWTKLKTREDQLPKLLPVNVTTRRPLHF